MLNLAQNILKRKSKVLLVASLTRWRLVRRLPHKETQKEAHKQVHKDAHREARTRRLPTVLSKNLPATGFTPSQKLKLYSQLSKAFPPFPRVTGWCFNWKELWDASQAQRLFLMSLRFWDSPLWKSFTEEHTSPEPSPSHRSAASLPGLSPLRDFRIMLSK